MSTMMERLQQMLASGRPLMPIAGLLGFRVKTVQPGTAIMEYETSEGHSNAMGTLHGGVLCTLADTAMGVAFFTMLQEGESLTTLELKINYLKPVWSGTLTAVARVVKRGRLTGFLECDVLDQQEQLIARASSTYMAISGEQAKNRDVAG